jgi:hypothetical protein
MVWKNYNYGLGNKSSLTIKTEPSLVLTQLNL